MKEEEEEKKKKEKKKRKNHGTIHHITSYIYIVTAVTNSNATYFIVLQSRH